jgi:hypothetical protein
LTFLGRICREWKVKQAAPELARAGASHPKSREWRPLVEWI